MEVVKDDEYLKKRVEELKDMSEKQEARVNYYDTKLHTVIVAYFIWERVFFFFVSQKANSPSSLSCNNSNLWVILALSCLCSLVYMLLFVDAALILYRTEHQLDLILRSHAQLYRQIWTIKTEAADTNIDPSIMEAGDDQSSHGLRPQEELILIIINSNSALFRRKGERKFYAYTIFCALLGVAALELYACKSMLCN